MVRSDNHPIKNTLALTFALAVITPAATSPEGGGHPLGGDATPSRPPAVEVIRVSTQEFDWGDAGIGAAGGIAVSMLAVGGGLTIARTRRLSQKAGATATPSQKSEHQP